MINSVSVTEKRGYSTFVNCVRQTENAKEQKSLYTNFKRIRSTMIDTHLANFEQKYQLYDNFGLKYEQKGTGFRSVLP